MTDTMSPAGFIATHRVTRERGFTTIEGSGGLIGAIVEYCGDHFESYRFRNGAQFIGQSTALLNALAWFWARQ